MSTAVPHEAEAHRSGGYPNQYNNNQNPGWFRKHPLLATAVWLLDWRSPHGELSASSRNFSETSSTGSMATPNSGRPFGSDPQLSNPDFSYNSNVAPSLDFHPDGTMQLNQKSGLALGSHHRQTFTLTPKALMPRSSSADSDDMIPNRSSAESRGDAYASSHGSRANPVGGGGDGSTPGSANWGWYVSTTPPSAQPYPSAVAHQQHIQAQQQALAEDKARAAAVRVGHVSSSPAAISNLTLAELNLAAAPPPIHQGRDDPPFPKQKNGF
mmetsp:Transcript_98966/g.283117  ORF Transcript_98966/g.283117 Transcript_98966/m.283117 type:complete len:269 (+) Transcript_98966:333-1139(+)|eukprot:CAMPEP_0119483978 /NCGR_PEP_ID=MMETSP1344-20130328/11140_1 /TAXON_ID=236787 /ORGANISM="Florenciella parvula, Strain CCMP2471" /LENGTH=268 /DNA_ID=CAMNT_0007518509 /DNA_START=333 /DNA_END=1139 /DNA_ORIENTATION=+